MSAAETPFRPQAQQKKDNTSCVLIGCLVVAGIGVLGIIAVVVGAAVGLPMLMNMALDMYTTDEPLELPVVSMGEQEYDELTDRMQTFGDALKSGDPVAPVTLTADEINALLQSNPEFMASGGQIYVEISSGDQMTGQVSLPVGAILPGVESAQGRYFNGEAVFTVGVLGNALFVGIDELVVNGENVPNEIMQSVRQENFATSFVNDPNMGPIFRQIEDIRVEDGKLLIIPKNALEDEGAEEEAASDEAA